ncbi:hypothetical protein C0991_003712, partial [Blastosporella zonata]
GKASVFLNGTYAFLKYAFKDVKQPFSGTVNLGNVANNDGPKAPNRQPLKPISPSPTPPNQPS